MATKVICVTNQKGGVGKTTTTVNLAHGLALRGKQVLIVDMDPQGHCATALGLEPDRGVFYLLTLGDSAAERTLLAQYVRPAGESRPGLFLLPGDDSTNGAQTLLNSAKRPISAVREALARFMRQGLDYIILDTAPSVGGIQERAIWASDLAIIPTSAEYLATDGVRKMWAQMLSLQRQDGWKGAPLGVLPTFFDDRVREHRAALEDLRRGFGERVLPVIHRAAVLGECPGQNRTIFEMDIDSRAAQEYAALVKLVLKF